MSSTRGPSDSDMSFSHRLKVIRTEEETERGSREDGEKLPLLCSKRKYQLVLLLPLSGTSSSFKRYLSY